MVKLMVKIYSCDGKADGKALPQSLVSHDPSDA